jgi:hypothetical protein
MKPDDLALAVGALMPFLGVYALGVALRRCHDGSHLHPDPQRLVQLVGEAAPGAIELILALTVVFGGLAKVQGETTAFQLVGILACAGATATRAPCATSWTRAGAGGSRRPGDAPLGRRRPLRR